MKKIILALLVVFFTISCATRVNNTEKRISLESTQWQLADETDAPTPTLIFSKNSVSGNASCNTFSGSFAADANSGSISFGNLAVTNKFCFNNNGVEENYLDALKKANRYETNNNELELYFGNALLVKFKKL